MSAIPPAFGPTEPIPCDDDRDAFATVNISMVVSREQLRAALAIGHAEQAGQPPLADLEVLDVRREVEGYLAAVAIISTEQETATARISPELLAELDAAIDRAYTRRQFIHEAQAPSYSEGTVTLQTLDRGEVTVPEPAWCKGHEGELVGPLSQVTHDGSDITADVDGLPLVRANLTHAPYLELEPEPHPLVYVEGLEAASFDADGLRQVVAEGRAFLDRLEALAGQLDALAEEGSS
ncbi:DUF6907 domain-containing protein [Streptomyces fulvoviolaceus]|uniref:DUF6907 domain-containing protein n=1 Tax=Streptomyces fulvoviolaceus TaxID=285535 RepID=UPI0021BEBC96|nr:hypothetical protein [Streptomyces fulvoviolaceus]MCT9078816.1 hypothetical protein [Streptomyces fulvoviolaceus]